MGKALINYLNKRLIEEKSLKKHNKKMHIAGPVITISREVGCNGLKLANLMALRLNSREMISDWNVLSKEVFYKSAIDLDLEPEHVRKVFKKSNKGCL